VTIGIVQLLAPMKLGLAVSIPLTLVMVVQMGAVLYRTVFEPLAKASVLVLLIAAFAVLVFFTEPSRTEKLIDARLVSLDHPMELKPGMVFALETYCPATDGFSAARIEEEVVVTDKGCQVITLFPAEELPIANRY